MQTDINARQCVAVYCLSGRVYRHVESSLLQRVADARLEARTKGVRVIHLTVYVCACVCVCARVCACACVYVCVEGVMHTLDKDMLLQRLDKTP